ncbi:MAG: hypothetical protein ACOYN8_13670 [Pseudanabaena sp.]|jgi:hypothetical protein
MPVAEPLTAPSLEHILAALEVRLELEEAIANSPLTQALEQCLLFTQTHNLPDVAQFVKQELDGYSSSQPPNNRLVHLVYFDAGGQAIDGLSQYSSYPLVTGVRKLERHLKNGLTLKLPSQILTFLSQVAGREVEIGHVSPAQIIHSLENIRNVTIRRFKQI